MLEGSMTKVAILPEPTEQGDFAYRAIAGECQSVGKTAGEALDALTAQLPADETGTLVVVQNLRPDSFFTAEQQNRLQQLMMRWRSARDNGQSLPSAEQAELDRLLEAEVYASTMRADALLKELRP
jgi:hypothetical protein